MPNQPSTGSVKLEANALKLPLLGQPNSGKSTLYNRLTGARTGTANFAGATQSIRSSVIKKLPSIELLDLPGFYEWNSQEPESKFVADWLAEYRNTQQEQGQPAWVLCVLDGLLLKEQLAWIQQVVHSGFKPLIAINKWDDVIKGQANYDLEKLAKLTQAEIFPLAAISGSGVSQLLSYLEAEVIAKRDRGDIVLSSTNQTEVVQASIETWEKEVIVQVPLVDPLTQRVDAYVLNPWFGLPLAFLTLLVFFQAVFVWSEPLIGWLEDGLGVLEALIENNVSHSLLQSFLLEGLLGGVGTTALFIVPVLIVAIFLNILEQSGFIGRLAILFDKVLVSSGLGGYSVFPILTGFSCAIPAIIACRSIPQKTQRLLTYAILPMIPCSARVPAYTLLVGVLIPVQQVAGYSLQGLVLFGIYTVGLLVALILAAVLSKTGVKPAGPSYMAVELPNYHLPRIGTLARIVQDRSWIFAKRVGGLITVATILMWILINIPISGPQVEQSLVGWMGYFLSWVFAPIGFGWQIATALIPGTFVAREVVVSMLAVVYQTDAEGLRAVVASWGLATSLSFLLWQMYAPQCLPTFITLRSELKGDTRTTLAIYGGLMLFTYLVCLVVYWSSRLIFGA